MVRHAHADAAGGAGHVARQRRRRLEQQRERPGPERARQRLRRRGSGPIARDLLRVGGDERKRAFGRAALCDQHAGDRVRTKRIGGESVQRVGRQRDEAAGPDDARGFRQQRPDRAKEGRPGGGSSALRVDTRLVHGQASESLNVLTCP